MGRPACEAVVVVGQVVIGVDLVHLLVVCGGAVTTDVNMGMGWDRREEETQCVTVCEGVEYERNACAWTGRGTIWSRSSSSSSISMSSSSLPP